MRNNWLRGHFSTGCYSKDRKSGKESRHREKHKGRPLIIHADGSCKLQSEGASVGYGPGGWAFVYPVSDFDMVDYPTMPLPEEGLPRRNLRTVFGKVENTTNSRIELMAAVQAIRLTVIDGPYSLRNRRLKIYSDSEYLVDGFNSRLENWERHGWRTNSNKTLDNYDLWEHLLKWKNQMGPDLRIVWGQGHDYRNNPLNSLVDMAAKEQSEVKRNPRSIHFPVMREWVCLDDPIFRVKGLDVSRIEALPYYKDLEAEWGRKQFLSNDFRGIVIRDSLKTLDVAQSC